MITRLRGILAEKDLTEIVVDVQGVGYAVSVPMSTYDRLPAVNSTVELQTHFHVREEVMALFGFSTAAERQLFRTLIGVSGIGPRLALNILSCMSVSQFCETVVASDLKALSRISGIGKRSAERLVVELRERVKEIEPAAGLAQDNEAPSEVAGEAQDAIAALGTLGFKTETARKVVEKLCRGNNGEKVSAENLIRQALAVLNS